jgi:hypothetical protein
MTRFSESPERSPGWSAEALALAAQAKVLSGNKLEQLVVRLQRHSGRPREACWRFVIQHGLKGRVDHRRWTDEEVDLVREEIVKRSVDEIARKLGRTPKSVRSMLQRNRLGVREIRCDLFSLESLAGALHIRKGEIRFWIQQGWLQASVSTKGRKRSYTITPESLAHAYKHHLPDLLKRGLPNQSLFEAYIMHPLLGTQTADEVRRCSLLHLTNMGVKLARLTEAEQEDFAEFRVSEAALDL